MANLKAGLMCGLCAAAFSLGAYGFHRDAEHIQEYRQEQLKSASTALEVDEIKAYTGLPIMIDRSFEIACIGGAGFSLLLGISRMRKRKLEDKLE